MDTQEDAVSRHAVGDLVTIPDRGEFVVTGVTKGGNVRMTKATPEAVAAAQADPSFGVPQQVSSPSQPAEGTLARSLNEARESCGRTIEDLAESVGIESDRAYVFFRGHGDSLTVRELRLLADALGFDLFAELREAA